jgi:hypothetical protein
MLQLINIYKGILMSFDLIKQDFSKSAELGYTFELVLPTGAPSGAKLTILGDMSPTVKAYSRRKFAEYQQKQVMARRKGKDADDLSLEQAEELAVESALVRLTNWEGITEEGKPVLFSKEKAEAVLTAHSWIREAIVQEASDVTNFQPKN